MRRTRVRLTAALLVMGLALGVTGGVAAASGSASRMVTQHGPAAAATVTKKLKIVDFAFSPKTVTISKGTRVRWTNAGAVSHTATSNAGKWDSGTIASGDSFSRVFRKAGTYLYHCSIHASMKGKIVVQ